MVRIALVDDEESYLDTLEGFLIIYQKRQGCLFEITKYRDGDEIVRDFHCQFDLIFLDIQMNFLNGMSAAQEIRRLDSQVVLMFITNRTDYAIKGYEVDALDYVLKPISYFEFSKKLERALSRLDKKSELIMSVMVSAGLKRVYGDDILYIESEGHNLVFHTNQEVFKTRARISDYEEELFGYGFFRCNKGCLVNLKYVDGVDGGSAVLGSERIPISRSRKQEFMTALTGYISNMQGG